MGSDPLVLAVAGGPQVDDLLEIPPAALDFQELLVAQRDVLGRQLDKIALGTFTGPAGTFRQRTELTKTQRDILAQLNIEPPPRIFQLTTETP